MVFSYTGNFSIQGRLLLCDCVEDIGIKILKIKNVSVNNRFGTGTYLFEWKKITYHCRNIKWLTHTTCMSYPGGGGCTPYDGLYGEAPPERGIFLRLHEFERLGILLVEVYKKVGKSACHLGL